MSPLPVLLLIAIGQAAGTAPHGAMTDRIARDLHDSKGIVVIAAIDLIAFEKVFFEPGTRNTAITIDKAVAIEA